MKVMFVNGEVLQRELFSPGGFTSSFRAATGSPTDTQTQLQDLDFV